MKPVAPPRSSMTTLTYSSTVPVSASSYTPTAENWIAPFVRRRAHADHRIALNRHLRIDRRAVDCSHEQIRRAACAALPPAA